MEVIMAPADVWWHQPWVRTAESVLGHIAALVVGFVMMVVGLGLGVTIIMLPFGIVIGLLGVAIFIGGLFARINQKA
jgi:archaellum biogenesis protein FlaJ (TadC family)